MRGRQRGQRVSRPSSEPLAVAEGPRASDHADLRARGNVVDQIRPISHHRAHAHCEGPHSLQSGRRCRGQSAVAHPVTVSFCSLAQ